MKRLLTFLAVAFVGTASACTGAPTSPASPSHTVPAFDMTAPASEEEQEKEQKGGGSMAVSGG